MEQNRTPEDTELLAAAQHPSRTSVSAAHYGQFDASALQIGLQDRAGGGV